MVSKEDGVGAEVVWIDEVVCAVPESSVSMCKSFTYTSSHLLVVVEFP